MFKETISCYLFRSVEGNGECGGLGARGLPFHFAFCELTKVNRFYLMEFLQTNGSQNLSHSRQTELFGDMSHISVL